MERTKMLMPKSVAMQKMQMEMKLLNSTMTKPKKKRPAARVMSEMEEKTVKLAHCAAMGEQCESVAS